MISSIRYLLLIATICATCYGQRGVIGPVPVGTVHKTNAFGEHQAMSSIANAKVGVYNKDNRPKPHVVPQYVPVPFAYPVVGVPFYGVPKYAPVYGVNKLKRYKRQAGLDDLLDAGDLLGGLPDLDGATDLLDPVKGLLGGLTG